MPSHHLAAARRRAAVAAVLSVLALVVGSVVGPSPAYACSCAEPPPPETALREADAVFTGEVTELTDEDSGSLGRIRVARVAVAEVFRGDVQGTTEVYTPVDSATCGYGFEVGRDELVYAVVDEDGRLQTNLCDRTAPVDDAEEDLAAFGDGVEPAATATDGTSERDGVTSVPSWLVPTLLVVGLAAVALVARRRAS